MLAHWLDVDPKLMSCPEFGIIFETSIISVEVIVAVGFDNADSRLTLNVPEEEISA